MDNSAILTAMVDKFPAFDPQWDLPTRLAWFDGWNQVLGIVDGHSAPSEPLPLPEFVAPPAQTAAAGGGRVPRVASPEQLERLRQLAASGATNREAVEATGLPHTTVSYHMTRLRKDVGTARPARPFRGGPHPAGDGRSDDGAQPHA